MEARHDFGLVETVKAEAIGEPGQRQFRLLLDGPGGEASLWMEKELLLQLSVAIRQLVAIISSGDSVEAMPPRSLDSVSPGGSLEFKVSTISLGYEPEEDLFLLRARSREDDEDEDDDDRPLMGFWTSRFQMEGLAEEAQIVCAAGRPLCQLCSAPMGPEPHICPKGNGHLKL